MISVIVGNPKPNSRTLDLAVRGVKMLYGSDEPLAVWDLAVTGCVPSVVEASLTSDVIVLASPTYKAAPSGLLKGYLDYLPSSGLAGKLVHILMTGGGKEHALAPDFALRPVVATVGGIVPCRAAFIVVTGDGGSATQQVDDWARGAAEDLSRLRGLLEIPDEGQRRGVRP